MSSTMHLFTGTLLVVVGAALALAFADNEFGWFQGRPLGIVLVVVGLFDLAQGITERRKDRE